MTTEGLEQPIFKGLRVIDCASYVAAPASATILSDWGAEILKIEPPEGDPFRYLFAPLDPFQWELDGRNKKSVCLDLKNPKGNAVLMKLVEGADVFVTNLLPEVRKKLGVDYQTLRKVNPRLVYASMTAYGEVGPEIKKTGFDATAYWARSGLQDIIKPDGSLPPASSVVGQGDHPASVSLFAAIVTGLYRRLLTGKGCQVGSSLLGNGYWSNSNLLQGQLDKTDLSAFTPRKPRSENVLPLGNTYKCKDGLWLFLAVLNDRQVPDLFRIMGCPEAIGDPRYLTTASRSNNCKELIAMLDTCFLTKTRAEFAAEFDKNGITFALISTLEDAVNDPQARAAGIVVPFSDGSGDTITSPLEIMGMQKVVPRRAPKVIGQDTREVLRGVLGMSEGEIERLKEEGAIKDGTPVKGNKNVEARL